MFRTSIPDAVDQVKIASPCSMDWEGMAGDDQVRFCQSCEKNVYDIRMMTRSEANKLLTSSEGTVCIRLFKRADGTVITQDCPVGLRMVREKIRKVRIRTCAAVALLVSMFGARPSDSFAQDAFTAESSGPPSCITASEKIDPLKIAQKNSKYQRSRAQGDALDGAVTLTGGGASTIGPQGADATVIRGMGTAGIVRVNNLANLEAFINIIALGAQLTLMTVGGAVAALPILHNIATPDDKKTVGLTTPVGLFLVCIGLLLPGFLNWAIASMRSCNLFS